MQTINKPTLLKNTLLVVAFLAVVLGSLLFVTLFAQKSFQCASLHLTLQSRPAAGGGTCVVIPPVGKVFFKTHRVPWQFVFKLDEVDFNSLEKKLGTLPKEQWSPFFLETIRQVLREFFFIMCGWGLLGGLVALVICRIPPTSRLFWIGMFLSLLTVVLLAGSILVSFDIHGLEQPQYQGALAAAPWVMNLISTSLDHIELIGANLRKVSGELPQLYRQAGRLENLGDLPTDLRVLHVSDIHNNPAAFEFIAELVHNFKINFIIDTGDLTDYGTALEASIIPKISQLRIPYLFIPGNHDTPLIIQRLKRIRNIHILSQGTILMQGLTIAGLADPASFVYSSDVSAKPKLDQARERLNREIARLSSPPDLVAVHNRYLGEEIIGTVPLLLHGHDHRYRVSEQRQTVIIDAGTTGAAGMRGLADKTPYSAAIMYWSKNGTGKLGLRVVDSIRINGYQGMMTIDRRIFKPADFPPAQETTQPVMRENQPTNLSKDN